MRWLLDSRCTLYGRAALGFFLLHAGTVSSALPDLPTWQTHPLGLRAKPVIRFDRSAIGNLANDTKGASLRLPRSHSFVTNISVGTPPTTMRCLIDTSFADLWVPHRICKGSSTFVPDMAPAKHDALLPWDPVKIRVDTGHKGLFVGYLGHDTVRFGSAVFENQSIYLVNEDILPKGRDWDGICGLGWHQIATRDRPLYSRVAKASHGGHAIFSFVPGAQHRAYIVAGEVPRAAIQENTLSWARAEPLKPGGAQGFWVVSGGLAIHRRLPVSSRFIIDTGTSFLLAPPNKYLLFIRSLIPEDAFNTSCGVDIDAGNLVVCDCAMMESKSVMPVRFYLGSKHFNVDFADLFLRVPAKDGGDPLCLLQIQENPVNSVDPLDLLGDVLEVSKPPVYEEEQEEKVEQEEWKKMPLAPAQRPLTAADIAAASTAIKAATTAAGKSVAESSSGGKSRSRISIDPVSVGPQLAAEAGPGRRLQREIVSLPGTQDSTRLGPTEKEVFEDLWVLGGVFIERFITILDFEENRVGFALPATNWETSGSTQLHHQEEQRRHQQQEQQKQQQQQQPKGMAKSELLADMRALARENAALKTNITMLESQLQLAKDFAALHEVERKERIMHLEEENTALRVNGSLLSRALEKAASALKKAHAGTLAKDWDDKANEVRVLDSTVAALRAQLEGLQQERDRTNVMHSTQWADMREDLKTLGAQNGGLLRTSAELRAENRALHLSEANLHTALIVCFCAVGGIILFIAVGLYSKMGRRARNVTYQNMKHEEARDVGGGIRQPVLSDTGGAHDSATAHSNMSALGAEADEQNAPIIRLEVE